MSQLQRVIDRLAFLIGGLMRMSGMLFLGAMMCMGAWWLWPENFTDTPFSELTLRRVAFAVFSSIGWWIGGATCLAAFGAWSKKV